MTWWHHTYCVCMYLHATCIARACIATTPHRAIYRLPNLPTPPPVCLLSHYYGRACPCVCNPRAQQATEVSGVGCDADTQCHARYSNSTESAHKLRYCHLLEITLRRKMSWQWQPSIYRRVILITLLQLFPIISVFSFRLVFRSPERLCMKYQFYANW